MQSASGNQEVGRGASQVAPLKFVGILAQLLVLLLLVERFHIESEAFLRLTALTVAGFAVHYFLPLTLRLPFLVVLSLAGVVMVLGLVPAAWLTGIGVVLIAISHLPIHVYARAAILVAIGSALAIPRWGLGEVPWSSAIWPILGSMFVFRMVSYLYDRAHRTEPTRLSQTLAYFFLLPNVCFPLFPLIDFKRFCRSYYDSERHAIYQVGVEWIWRGLIQLIAYRLVYFHLTVDPVAVDDLGDLALYILSTFFLYVRLSGYFHIVVGMLHLFGFNLPETHHRYFLAASFTDFWRRINIYWKDFMMKVVYYPAFFRLRRLGDTSALVLATLLTFVVTWFLHMVQWFWIRGSVLVEWNDILFWSLFAGLVLANSLWEARRGRSRVMLKRERTLSESAGLVLRTAGTFITIAVLWSFWTAESATEWLLMCAGAWRLPDWSPAQWWALAVVVPLGLSVAVYGTWRGATGGQPTLGPQVEPRTVFATSLVLCVATVPALVQPFGASSDMVESLRLASMGLNQRDAEAFQRGYYENLLDVGRFNAELRSRYEQMPTDFVRSLTRLGITQDSDEQESVMLPLKEGRFMGALVQTNRWGFRDRDYSQQRPDGTYRIALLGASLTMGSGVEEDETFGALIEDRLNREMVGARGMKYEVLNFAVAGYASMQVLYQLRHKVLPFEPNAVMFTGHSIDRDRNARHFTQMIRRNRLPPDPYLRDLAGRTGIHAGTGSNESRRRMKPYERELLAWVYSRVAEDCRTRGIEPIFLYLPTVTESMESWQVDTRREVLELAERAGFRVIDLTGVYDPYESKDLWILENDSHPNALGHRLIADRLYEGMRQTSVMASSRPG